MIFVFAVFNQSAFLAKTKYMQRQHALKHFSQLNVFSSWCIQYKTTWNCNVNILLALLNQITVMNLFTHQHYSFRLAPPIRLGTRPHHRSGNRPNPAKDWPGTASGPFEQHQESVEVVESVDKPCERTPLCYTLLSAALNQKWSCGIVCSQGTQTLKTMLSIRALQLLQLAMTFWKALGDLPLRPPGWGLPTPRTDPNICRPAVAGCPESSVASDSDVRCQKLDSKSSRAGRSLAT